MNPYGIEQVDVPGALAVYNSARSQRLQEMMANRQMDREDRKAAFDINQRTALANVFRPKGGDPASTVAPSTVAPSAVPMEAAPQAALASHGVPRTDGYAINQEALSAYKSAFPEEGLQLDEALYKADGHRIEAARKRAEGLGVASGYLSRFTSPEQRETERRAIAPLLAGQYGIPEHEVLAADISDQGLKRYHGAALGFKDVVSQAEPKYTPVPYDGELVNVHDPEAVAAFQRGGGAQTARVAVPTSRAEYEALAPGAQYQTPDGQIRIKKGPTPAASGNFPGVSR